MSIEFVFSNFKDASSFGKRLSKELGITSGHRRLDEKQIISIPERSLTRVNTAALTTTAAILGLIAGNALCSEEVNDRVIESMIRANPSLAGLSEDEIGSYLSSLSQEQLQGIINNTKGMYHEMLFVEAENSDLDGVEASLAEDINNPGFDVLLSRGNDIQEIQLKATDSSSYITEHQEKYPDIEVVATEEVASKMNEVESSGFSNAEIESDVDETINALGATDAASELATEAVSATLDTIGLGRIGLLLLTGGLFGL